MAEVDYEQAVQTLRSHMGSQYEGLEADGRNEMAEILKRELGYSGHQADEAIDAMIRGGTLRYVHGDSREGVVAAAPPGGAGSVSGGAYGAQPIAPVPLGGGYWQIGQDEGSDAPGRKGQVAPS